MPLPSVSMAVARINSKHVDGSVGDLLLLFSKNETRNVERVVLITLAGPRTRMLELVRRSAVPDLDAGAIRIPASPHTSP